MLTWTSRFAALADIAAMPRPSWRAMAIVLWPIGFVLLLVTLDQSGMPAKLVAGVGLILPLVVYGLAGLPAFIAALVQPGADAEADAKPARRPGIGEYQGLKISAAVASTLPFLWISGAFFQLGHDALAVGLGLALGLVVAAVVVAPALVGSCGPLEYTTKRFGRGAGFIAAPIILGICFLILSSQITNIAMLVGYVTGFPFTVALAVAAACLALVAFPSRTRLLGPGPTLQGALLIAALVVIGAVLALTYTGNALAPLAYGAALPEIGRLEVALLSKKLADANSLKGHTSPYLSMDALSFFGTLLTVAGGIAVAPHLLILGRSFANRASARAAATSTLLLSLPLLILLPAVAVFAKLGLFRLISGSIKIPDLPTWIADLARAGMLKVCGADTPDSFVAACSRISGHKGVLRLHDLDLAPEAVWLSVSALAGLPGWISALALSAALAAGLATATAVLAVVSATCSPPRDCRILRPDDAPGLGFLVGPAMVVCALLWIHLAGRGEVATLTRWALPLAASSLLPPVLSSLAWGRVGGAAVIVGMVSGLVVTLYYLAVSHYAPIAFVEVWGWLSNAPPSAFRKLATLRSAAEASGSEAAAAAVLVQARGMANWWGLRADAAGLIGMPVGFLATVAISLVIPARRSRSVP